MRNRYKIIIVDIFSGLNDYLIFIKIPVFNPVEFWVCSDLQALMKFLYIYEKITSFDEQRSSNHPEKGKILNF